MRRCQAGPTANTKDGVKMTSTGAACSLEGRSYTGCPGRHQKREESKRRRSVSGRRSNGIVSTSCTMENISYLDEANAQKLPIYHHRNTQPFPSSHTSPHELPKISPPHSYPAHPATLPPYISHPSHLNPHLNTYPSPHPSPNHLTHTTLPFGLR